MYSFYAVKYYYKPGDPVNAAADKVIDRLTKEGTMGHISGFTRINVDEHPAEACKISGFPAFVHHGEVVYEAKGDETEQDWDRIIKVILKMADPKVVGAL